MIQREIDWEREQKKARILRLTELISEGEIFVLLAINDALCDVRRAAAKIPIGRLLNASGYKERRFYQLIRKLKSNKFVVTRHAVGTFSGDGVEYWIDWEAIDAATKGNREHEHRPEAPESDQESEVCKRSAKGLQKVCTSSALGLHSGGDFPPPYTSSPPKEEITNTSSYHSTSLDESRAAGEDAKPSPEEEEWEEVELILIQAGLGDAEGAIASARSRHCRPEHVRDLIVELEKYPGRWTPTEIHRRVRNHHPKLDPKSGWPAGEKSAVEAYKRLVEHWGRILDDLDDAEFPRIAEKYLGEPHTRASPHYATIRQRIIDERIRTLHREQLTAGSDQRQ